MESTQGNVSSVPPAKGSLVRKATRRGIAELTRATFVAGLVYLAFCTLGNPLAPDVTLAGVDDTGAECSSLDMAGDANGNEELGITDALMILTFLFAGGDPPVDVCCAGLECDCPFTDEEAEQLLALLEYISVDEDEYEFDDESPYPKVVFSGCNVQIVNGLGATNGDDTDPFDFTPTGSVVNGLGNLIVGYNELRDDTDPAGFEDNYRNGSHNIVVGIKNNYPSFGGLVAGRTNEAVGAMSNVNGGYLNIASGLNASVCGGCTNTAGTGLFAHVCGGRENISSASFSVVVGGGGDEADLGNEASSVYSVVVGGNGNDATGVDSVVVGGEGNEADGIDSVVVGGDGNVSSGEESVVVGGTGNDAAGEAAVVSGGSDLEEGDENGWSAEDG